MFRARDWIFQRRIMIPGSHLHLLGEKNVFLRRKSSNSTSRHYAIVILSPDLCWRKNKSKLDFFFRLFFEAQISKELMILWKPVSIRSEKRFFRDVVHTCYNRSVRLCISTRTWLWFGGIFSLIANANAFNDITLCHHVFDGCDLAEQVSCEVEEELCDSDNSRSNFYLFTWW